MKGHQKPRSAPKIGDPDPGPPELPPGVLRPGGLREDPKEEETPEPAPSEAFAKATYHGLTDEEAREVQAAESLCPGCYHRNVCRHRPASDGPLIVISRCVAFSPLG